MGNRESKEQDEEHQLCDVGVLRRDGVIKQAFVPGKCEPIKGTEFFLTYAADMAKQTLEAKLVRMLSPNVKSILVTHESEFGNCQTHVYLKSQPLSLNNSDQFNVTLEETFRPCIHIVLTSSWRVLMSMLRYDDENAYTNLREQHLPSLNQLRDNTHIRQELAQSLEIKGDNACSQFIPWGWQLDLLGELVPPPDGTTVLWHWEPKECMGKRYMRNYLLTKHPGVFLPVEDLESVLYTAGRVIYALNNGFSGYAILVWLSRSFCANDGLKKIGPILQVLKDSTVMTDYEHGISFQKPYSHVIVMSNDSPDGMGSCPDGLNIVHKPISVGNNGDVSA